MLKFQGKMARELVWFENSSFAAWGCTMCSWLLPNAGPSSSVKPPTTVKEAFNQHECAQFPRLVARVDQRESKKP